MLGAAAAGAAALAAYARYVEPRWIERTHTRVGVEGLPPALEGLRLALLTDLHVGRRTSLRRVRQACRLVMAARPDLVALTGDLVSTGSARLPEVLDLLEDLLSAPLGTYVVPGNHDHAAGIRQWTRSMPEHPRLRDVTNRAVDLERGGATLRVAGIDDLDAGRPRPGAVAAGARAADLTVLLSHNPDVAEVACEALGGVDLVVSGHTHGGQVRLPGVGALYNPSRYGARYEAGLRRRPWTQVYVSRGVGTVHLHLRLLSRPEVALLEFVSA